MNTQISIWCNNTCHKLNQIILLFAILILGNSTCLARPKIYIALSQNKASQQIRQAVTTNYVALGSDDYHYDMDAWRNSMLSKVTIEFVEWPNHEVINCPAIRHGTYPHYQSLPDIVFPEAEYWLFFIEYMVDVFEFEHRHNKWKSDYNTMIHSIMRTAHRYYVYQYLSNEEEIDIDLILQKFKYEWLQEPKQIKCPIPNWEYK